MSESLKDKFINSQKKMKKYKAKMDNGLISYLNNRGIYSQQDLKQFIHALYSHKIKLSDTVTTGDLMELINEHKRIYEKSRGKKSKSKGSKPK